MKRLIYVLFFALISLVANGQAKYVFYFIGDGMGVNQVNAAEMYLAEKEGQIGIEPLLFTQFPTMGVSTTFSATNSVTDSAAAGTALATGHKTYNGAIGIDEEKNRLESVAMQAKKAGKKVGITSNVSLDHATPAAFYAHQPKRNMYYEIATDLPKANFDFYAGAGFLKPTTTMDKKDAPSIYPLFEKAGYTIARGVNDFKAKASKASKMVLLQEQGANASSLPYAIDREETDMTLAEITESAISFLTKKNRKGFFLMVEGGQIDWACHGNDAATAIEEVKDMDDAIKIAYAFYKKHPKETLIVVTADHETGGIVLGTGSYELNLKALEMQKCSAGALSAKIGQLRKEKSGKVSWEDVKALLAEEMGFWKELPISWEQEKMLRDEYEESFAKGHVVLEENLYAKSEPLAARAKEVMNQIARVSWAHGGHSAGYVPVYAIGVGSELFQGKMDNTDIPKRIAKAAKY